MHGSTNEEHLDYAQSIEFMGQRHNRQLIQQTEVFRQRGIGDFSLLRGQLFHQRIIGINQTTIGGLIMSPRLVCVDTWFGMFCIPLPEFAEDLVGSRRHHGAGAQRRGRRLAERQGVWRRRTNLYVPWGQARRIAPSQRCPVLHRTDARGQVVQEPEPGRAVLRGRDWTLGVRRSGDAPRARGDPVEWGDRRPDRDGRHGHPCGDRRPGPQDRGDRGGAVCRGLCDPGLELGDDQRRPDDCADR